MNIIVQKPEKPIQIEGNIEESEHYILLTTPDKNPKPNLGGELYIRTGFGTRYLVRYVDWVNLGHSRVYIFHKIRKLDENEWQLSKLLLEVGGGS